MRAKAFENVKNQIGYCGIWCGSCVVGNGTLRELTKKYETIIENYDLEGWAPQDFDFKEFEKGLASIQTIPLCPGCLKGGGRSNCEMKSCATNKGITDCSQCDQPKTCENLEILQKMRTGASDAGLHVKTKDIDPKELIRNWTKELKTKWPCCILFLK
ncbi:MAG: DUF3795 domain-containing protein [Candidatus Bathyarchaeota archaeon]|nr:MAG: DUF3795 domain-containing protein [Candidatus Bathyarchaeota archaeon]